MGATTGETPAPWDRWKHFTPLTSPFPACWLVFEPEQVLQGSTKGDYWSGHFKLTPLPLAALTELDALCTSGLVFMIYLPKFPLAAELGGVIKHFLSVSTVTVPG